jgi:formate dehydrogenase iron-sulfur subunit
MADETATPVDIVRTGSRGMLWLEPLLEIEIEGVRHGFGPIEPDRQGD